MINLPSNNPNDIPAGYNANRKTVKAKAKGMLQAGKKSYISQIIHERHISSPYDQ
ncbi:MAG TPA: hypothetical protein VFI73_08375 [Candidatus Nitrosopolaris sp.]|nr:hypothetical protein [Candidatus Nitrosopolaris sp.]